MGYDWRGRSGLNFYETLPAAGDCTWPYILINTDLWRQLLLFMDEYYVAEAGGTVLSLFTECLRFSSTYSAVDSF